MKLVEQGKLTLETSLYDLFPELRNDKFVHVTLGDFLSHRSQVAPFMNNEFEKLKFKGSVSEKRYQLAKYLLKRKPLKKAFNYSNAGYVIAALMLEKASSRTYEQLLEINMQALGLSYFIGFPNKENKLNPWGHRMENGRLTPLKPNHRYKMPDYMVSATDVSMNIEDYAKFIQLHLIGLQGKDNYLAAKNYEMLHYGLKGYSYGWANRINENIHSSSHFGSLGTFYCYVVLIEKADIAIIFMLNSYDSKHIKAAYKLVRKLMEHLYE